jgi:curved DNA-binding protein CbpA
VNPFAALGLPARADLSDAQVRTAWKDIAARTHPDRPDGGDITAYTAAATAYAQLRTPWGRSEACADHAASEPYVPAPGPPSARRPGEGLWRGLRMVPARIRHGRPLRLLARALATALLSLLILTLIPGQPSGPAVVTGLTLWFLFTARADLAPSPGR